MVYTRVMPALLLRNESLVKTIRFGKPTYVGDPCNTVRIFNELEVDELLFFDITATLEQRGPNLKVLKNIADECFMPLTYGGGISSFDQVREILQIGFEKVVINSCLYSDPPLIKKLVDHFGSQAIVASIDVKQNLFGKIGVYTKSGKKNIRKDPVEWAQDVEKLGVGEILLTSIEREGSWSGFDLPLIRRVSENVSVPVIAHGGGSGISDMVMAKSAGASAMAIGSMVVFQKKGMGVLVTFPDRIQIEDCLR
jgi:imidazole glycerol-phosphate synthase subunit HisF